MTESQKSPPLYVTIPRDLAFDARNHQFAPFELALIGGILAAAHRARGNELFAARFARGAAAIKAELALAEKHKADWQKVHRARRKGVAAKAPRREHVHRKPSFKGGIHGDNLRGAGRHGYHEAGAAQRNLSAPDTLSVVISKSNLLVTAGLSRDGTNLKRLDQALRQLRRPVTVSGQRLPALLTSHDTDLGGKLHLKVSGAWFAMQYVRVPLPLPTRSRPALSLYLFSLCIWTNKANSKDMRFSALCKRIGVELDRFRQRAFDRALDIVNAHLQSLDEEALHWHRIKMPARLEIVVNHDERRVRLLGIARPYRGEQGYDFSSSRLPKRPRRAVKRFRAPEQAADFEAHSFSVLDRPRLSEQELRERREIARAQG